MLQSNTDCAGSACGLLDESLKVVVTDSGSWDDDACNGLASKPQLITPLPSVKLAPTIAI